MKKWLEVENQSLQELESVRNSTWKCRYCSTCTSRRRGVRRVSGVMSTVETRVLWWSISCAYISCSAVVQRKGFTQGLHPTSQHFVGLSEMLQENMLPTVCVVFCYYCTLCPCSHSCTHGMDNCHAQTGNGKKIGEYVLTQTSYRE